MAQNTDVEMVDVDDQNQDEAEAGLQLSLNWSESDQKKRKKNDLEKSLQTWFNRNMTGQDCTVKKIWADGAEVQMKPVPGLLDLQKLSGQTLTMKDGKTVTIISVNLALSQLDPQTPDNTSVSFPPQPVAVPQADKDVQKVDQSDPVPTAGNTEEKCVLSLTHFLYVSNIYKEEIKLIEEKYGGKITGELSVTFKADQEDGRHRKALTEFTNLVQENLLKMGSSVIPLRFVDPDQLGDALKILQKKENNLMLTMCSEEATVSGPKESQEAFSEALNAMQKTKPSLKEGKPAPQDTYSKIRMTIKDPLVDGGLTMEERSWKLLTASYGEQVAKIRAKFDVDLKDSKISQDKVNVKAVYQRPEGNASMESHAVRALLALYQKTSTSVLNVTQFNGASGFNGSQENLSSGHHSEETTSGPGPKTHLTLQNAEARTGGGATARESEEDSCVICIGPFIAKKQLKCKHEFCEKCLEKAVKYGGPICPICKDVFGVMEGDQPRGRMTCSKYPSSVPGFSDCGHIAITYDIPSGTQTDKHPSPGQPFVGTTRHAYLPDNKEGNEVLRLLRKAFDQKLIFTVGESRTSGIKNQVTWNDIHHKTSIEGGPQRFGYPDQDYLTRVKEELKAKGIV